MKTTIFRNMKVSVISGNETTMELGKVTPGNILLRDEEHMVVMPMSQRDWKRAPHNPLVYEGRFFSSRQKQNGNISLHGVIASDTNLSDAYEQAKRELDEFFSTIELLS